MNLEIEKQFELMKTALSQLDAVSGTIFGCFFLSVWFAPTILAVFFNRKHVKKIFLANIPAGLSWAVWGALIIWASTGEIRAALKKHKQAEENGGEL